MLEDINYITKRPHITVKKVAATRSGKAAARYRAAAEEFTRRIRDELGDRIQAVALYGPAAQGIKPGDHDRSLYVVAIGDGEYVDKICSDIALDVAEKRKFMFFFFVDTHTVEQATVDLRPGSWRRREVLEEGIVLYDNGFFSRTGQPILPIRR